MRELSATRAPALEGVSLVIRPGELNVLMGASGSGKSTFAWLLVRLFDPGDGDARLGRRGLPLRGMAAGRPELDASHTVKAVTFAALGLPALAFAPAAPAASALVSGAHAAPLTGSRPLAKRSRVVLRSLRMCTKAAYHAPSHRCLRDERARPVVSSTALCTIEIQAYSAVTVRARMEFAGGTQYAYTKKLEKRTRFQLAFGVEFPATMPAGSYRCRFTVGPKKASATMRSAGPSGPVVWTAACSSSLLRPDGSGCGSDASASPLPAAESLSCSGWAVGQQGKRVTVELLRNDAGAWTAVDGAELRPRRPISALWISVPPLLGAPFLAGEYACRFSVDGRLLAEKLFTVA